jgi:hypothetical protein
VWSRRRGGGSGRVCGRYLGGEVGRRQAGVGRGTGGRKWRSERVGAVAPAQSPVGARSPNESPAVEADGVLGAEGDGPADLNSCRRRAGPACRGLKCPAVANGWRRWWRRSERQRGVL